MQEITELKKLAGDLSVLLVLNNDLLKEQTLSYLETIFIKIEYATHSQKALELYKQKTPDIVITSLDFNSMSGFEFIKNLKKLNAFLPIIIISKQPKTEDLLELIHLGIVDFVTTPTEEIILKKAIEKAVGLLHFIANKDKNEKVNEDDSPISALEELFKRHLEIQLVSNYKGIPIVHTGKIVAIYKDMVQIQTRKIQAKAIEFTKKTILESKFLPNDIEATLVNIDPKNAEVSLNNLKYIEYSPKRRKHARLTPSEDMKLMAYKKGGSKINIELKDISLTSLTFEVKTLPDFFGIDVILDLKIAFDIPENDLAYYVDKLCIINFQGKIIKIYEENASYYVNIEFELPKMKEDIFNQYMYNRELSIIREFKQFATKKS
ncbi:MAG: response regulator [Arcobacteraceae bacterium]